MYSINDLMADRLKVRCFRKNNRGMHMKELITERLIIRPWKVTDLEGFYEYVQIGLMKRSCKER